LDTIDPGSFALWTKTGHNPYQASIRGDKIYGLGAADVKLDFLCKLFAMKKTNWDELRGNALLLGTFGEEGGMRGAIKAVRERMIKPSPALIGEPTGLNVIHAGKGIAQIEIIIPFPSKEIDEWGDDEMTGSTQSKIFQGKAAHSSSPELGENAVEKMLDYLEKLPEEIHLVNVDGGVGFNTIPTQASLEFDLNTQGPDQKPRQLREIYRTIKKLEKQFAEYPDVDFDPPIPTLNIGLVRTFKDHIQMAGAVRWSSHIDERKYVEWMTALGDTCKEQKAVFRILDVKKPFYTDKTGPFAELCLRAAKAVENQAMIKTHPVTNEANVFSKFGFECVVFGPGHRQNNSHTPEEHVELADLQKAEDFYHKVIQQVCL
jgi:succinyl-diaminopimelate desuccinylase